VSQVEIPVPVGFTIWELSLTYYTVLSVIVFLVMG